MALGIISDSGSLLHAPASLLSATSFSSSIFYADSLCLVGQLLHCEFDKEVIYYKIAFDSLVQGGIDLSMKKWMELVSLRLNSKK